MSKLTFSLSSLIFILALGLVFVPTAVMAHTDVQRDVNDDGDADDAGDIGPHDHPVLAVTTAVAADATTVPPSPAIQAIPVHNGHPTATISLKPGDTVRGQEVVVTDANPGTTDVVTLVVQFDMPVGDGAGGTVTTVQGC